MSLCPSMLSVFLHFSFALLILLHIITRFNIDLYHISLLLLLISDQIMSLTRILVQRSTLTRILSRSLASSTESSTTKIPVSSDKSSEVYDEKSEYLQKIDIEDLPRAQKRFAKQFEKVNDERIKEIFAKNYKVS